jgi:hypothetical protein
VALAATASSGLPGSYISTTPTVCIVSGSTASLLIPGNCILQASQAGNSVYAAAAPVGRSFTVYGAGQTITFPAITGNQYALTQVALGATASSGLPVSYVSTTPTVCTVSGSTASLLISGNCILQASQAGNSVYAAAAPVGRSVAVHAAGQTITFPAITGTQYALTQVALGATASSGLPVSYLSTTPTVCTVSGSTASLLIPGACILQASQAGNGVYAAAAPVGRSFTVYAK